MRGVIIFITVLSTFLACVHAQGCEPYQSFPDHTMCIYFEKACPTGTLIRSGELTQAQKDEIVDIHNSLRASLVAGEVSGQPKAYNMTTLVWDDELATIAQRAADQCNFAHDKMRDVSRFYVGQNIAGQYRKPVDPNTDPDMTAAAMAWWDEVYDPGFNPDNISPFKFDSGTGHYSQMAWYTTSTIGCGYVFYSDNTGWGYKHIFCNYGEGGNLIGGTMYIVD